MLIPTYQDPLLRDLIGGTNPYIKIYEDVETSLTLSSQKGHVEGVKLLLI